MIVKHGVLLRAVLGACASVFQTHPPGCASANSVHNTSGAVAVRQLPSHSEGEHAMQSMTFKIRGMDCAEEVAVLQRAVGPVVGGEAHLAFDILNGTMTVDLAQETVSEAAVRQAVARTGMPGAALAGGQRDSTRRDGLAAPCTHHTLCRQWAPPRQRLSVACPTAWQRARCPGRRGQRRPGLPSRQYPALPRGGDQRRLVHRPESPLCSADIPTRHESPDDRGGRWAPSLLGSGSRPRR
jgi:copper chaperone CopZ